MVLTKNGRSYVALIDARKLDHYHALEEAFCSSDPVGALREYIEQHEQAKQRCRELVADGLASGEARFMKPGHKALLKKQALADSP